MWRECYHVESRTLLYMLQKENIYSNFYFIIESLFAFRISYLVTRLTCIHTRTFASRRKNKNTFGYGMYNNNNNNSICFVCLLLPQYREFVTRKMCHRSFEGYSLFLLPPRFSFFFIAF